MAEWLKTVNEDELKEGTMKRVTVGANEILLARVGTKLYATDNRCPHLAGNLSRGKLVGTVIVCPRHASSFDLKDGSMARWTNWPGWLLLLSRIFKPPHSLKVYLVKVESGSLMIEI